ncbi:MAG: magnesium transporter, partial [Candidatus Omnitrophota bacterium]
TRKLLNILPPEERREALQLLDYPENSVGRLMTPDYVALKKSWTVEEAIEHIRKYGKDAETINMLYVVDENWHLVDEIPIRRLILAERTQTIESLMDYHFISIAANSDQEEAIKLFEKYNLVALPVTDSESRLLGIITVDDIIDAIREEQTEDFTRFSAIKAKSIDLELFTRIKEIPFRKIFRARISWLFLLLIMDLVTGGIIQGFQETIAKYVVLVTFLPVLVDTAGNAGSQSATLVIRALALGTVKLKDWLFLLGRELLVALGLGLTMGLGISFMGFLRGGSLQVASVVVLAMVINVIVGCLVGVLLPFIFTRLKKDPATASTPLITTLADIMGTGIYLGIAYLMLG